MIDLIIAIDPGASGSISAYKNGKVHCVKMPEKIFEIKEYLQWLIDGTEKQFCFIERVQGWSSDTDHPGKRFQIQKMLDNYSKLKTILTMLEIPFHETNSRKWQKPFIGSKKFSEPVLRKRYLKEVAEKKFKKQKVTLYNCDALLILLWGVQEMKTNSKNYL